MGAISWDAGWILSEDRQLGDFAVTGIVWPDGIGVCGGFAGCVSAECWLIFFFGRDLRSVGEEVNFDGGSRCVCP